MTATRTATATPTATHAQPAAPQCSDRTDNDGDGSIDFPEDLKCESPLGSEQGAPVPASPVKAYGWSPGGATHEHIVPLYRYIYPPDDIPAVDQLADYLLAMPPGQRGVIFINEITYDLIRKNPLHACVDPVTGNRLDARFQCPWLEVGTEQTRQKFHTFFSRLHQRGASLEVMGVNYEMTALDYWASAALGGMANDPARYLAIQRDPRFHQANTTYPIGDPRRESIASMLGFSDLSRVWQWQPASGDTPYHAIWNNLMFDRTAAYLTDAIYGPARSFFPNIKLSDNPQHRQDASFNLPDSLGSVLSVCQAPYYCSSGRHVGTHQNPTVGYESMLTSAFAQNAILFDGVRPYRATSFNTMRWLANKFRVMNLSAPEVPVSPTIGCKSFGFAQNDEFYQEQLIHATLSGVDFHYLWNPTHPYWTGIVNDCPRVEEDNEIVNKVLREFNSLAGARDRQPIAQSLQDWYSDWVLTGARSGRRKIWRFAPMEYASTPSAPGQSINETLISESPPTFRTRQNIVVFHQGTIYRPPNPISSLGFWVSQPIHAPDPSFYDDGQNSAPILHVTVNTPNTVGWRYVDASSSYDDDGIIQNWHWDFGNDGVEEWWEHSINQQNRASFWSADIPPHMNSVRLRATDNQGASSQVVVQIPQ